MVVSGEHFSAGEVAEVLSHYDVGEIIRTEPLRPGSGRVPKIVVTSRQGKFVLKRRPGTKNGMTWRVFVHAVQRHLAKETFPVPQPIVTRDENETILQINSDVYELFEFVVGGRYDGSVQETLDAGRQLAVLHRHLADFEWDYKPARGSFHDSKFVRRELKKAGTKRAVQPDERVQREAETLMYLYNEASVRVNELGFASWDVQVVHGDWHPGNMLFRGRRLAAVLDFDSTRLAPPVTDIANGMLQFSLVASRPNPADWPAFLDEARLTAFADGYRQVIEPAEEKTQGLADLMIEALIAEAIAPVAQTGSFERTSGADFLKMIERKARWILGNREKLDEAVRL
jgi:homoserine kinase type II